MTADPLDGYRAVSPEEELAPIEQLLKRQMAENAKLIQLVTRSEALQLWLETPAGEGLQNLANIRLNDAMKALLHTKDLTTKVAQEAHFQARVCIGMIEMIDEVLKAGPEARAYVEASDAAANAEINNDGA